MATAQKPVYATAHTTYGGKLFQPGERMDDRVSPEVARSALEGGIASDSSAAADRARASESERREHVREEIASRSEKKESTERRAGNIPQLVRMPDGSYAEVQNR